MSRSSMRRRLPGRAVVAATSAMALGAALAAAGAASAARIPLGSASDAPYSGIGPASSLNAVANDGPAFLASAANMLVAAGDPNPALVNAGTPWTASTMNDSVSSFVVADFTGVPFAGLSPTKGSYLAKLKKSDRTYTTDAQKIEDVGGLYTDIFLTNFFSKLGSSTFPGGLYTVDHDMKVTSTATVTAPAKPAAYTMTLSTAGRAAGATTNGFVNPESERFTFPKSFELNLSLIKHDIPHADIWDPTKDGGKPIGTLSLESPAASLITGNDNSDIATGQVFVVHSKRATDLLPQLELWISGPYGASGVEVAVLGTLSGVSFPQTVTFGTPLLGGGLTNSDGKPLQMALALSRLTVSFPAATSPYIIPSCTSATAPSAGVADSLAPFAADFGDTSDGYDAATGTTSPVSVPSAATVVTDACAQLHAGGGSASGIKQGHPAFGFTLGDTQRFSTFSVRLPAGVSYRHFTTRDLTVTGTTGSGAGATAVTVKRASTTGSKLTVTLSGPTRKVRVRLSGGIAETRSARSDRTVTLTLGAGGSTIPVRIRA